MKWTPKTKIEEGLKRQIIWMKSKNQVFRKEAIKNMLNDSMNEYSDVSVVMGSRNEEKAIRKVITDIQKATNNQAEIVVVDGSSDRTPEIAEELGAKVIRQKPQGYGVAVKKALLSATRDIIITVDCDDKVFRRGLELSIRKCQE